MMRMSEIDKIIGELPENDRRNLLFAHSQSNMWMAPVVDDFIIGCNVPEFLIVALISEGAWVYGRRKVKNERPQPTSRLG